MKGGGSQLDALLATRDLLLGVAAAGGFVESAARRNCPVAITLLTGFLGAGKTTLLRRMIEVSDPASTAIIVNDFGALNIDAASVGRRSDAVIELSNGCICCGLGMGLAKALGEILRYRPTVERIFIEASGVADPAPIIHTALGFESVSLDVCVTLVDAEQFEKLWAEPELRTLLCAQVRSADIVLLNKADLAEGGVIGRLSMQLAQSGVTAPLLVGSAASIPLQAFGEVEATRVPHSAHAKSKHFHTRSWTGDGAFDGAALREIFTSLPAGLLRAKGFVRLRHRPWEWRKLQLVGHRWSLDIAPPGLAPVASAVVAIGLEESAVDTLIAGLEKACFASS